MPLYLKRDGENSVREITGPFAPAIAFLAMIASGAMRVQRSLLADEAEDDIGLDDAPNARPKMISLADFSSARLGSKRQELSDEESEDVPRVHVKANALLQEQKYTTRLDSIESVGVRGVRKLYESMRSIKMLDADEERILSETQDRQELHDKLFEHAATKVADAKQLLRSYADARRN